MTANNPAHCMLHATSADSDQSLYIALREIWSLASHSAADFIDGKSMDYGWRLSRTATRDDYLLTEYACGAQGIAICQESSVGLPHRIALVRVQP